MKYPTLFLLLTLVALFTQSLSTAGAETVEVGNEGEVKKSPKKSPGKKSQKNWAKVDYNALEKEWENGDDERELEHEYEISRKIQEKKRKKGPSSASEALKMAKKDPFHLNSGSGGTLMFAKLRKRKGKKDWTNKEVDKVASRWSSMLRSAGTDVKVVNIGAQGGADTETGTLLLSVDKAWWTSDVVTFTLKQKETEKITVNGHDYTSKDLPKEDDED